MFKIKALLLKVLLCPGADQALRDKRACDQRWGEGTQVTQEFNHWFPADIQSCNWFWIKDGKYPVELCMFLIISKLTLAYF